MAFFKRSALATVSLGALLGVSAFALQTPAQDAQRREAMPTSDDSGTMKRANNEMRRVLKELMALGAKPLGSQSVEETRKGPTPADAVKAVLKSEGKDPMALMAALKITKKDMSYPTAGGTQPVRIYSPEAMGSAPLPVIVYYHGGGWVIADLDTYEASAIALAKKVNAIVVSVEYRHAPENKFPAAHEDAIAAYKWAVQNAGQFNGDPRRVAIAGESAGGNLALNVAIAAREQKLQKPAYMLLVYPVSGTDMNTPSYQKNANAVPLSKQAMEWFVANTISKPEDKQDPRLDLIGKANLQGLPNATVITAEIDPLMSEGKMLAEKLQKAGSKVTYENFDGVTHEFFGMNAVLKDAEQAQGLAARGIGSAFAEAGKAEALEKK